MSIDSTKREALRVNRITTSPISTRRIRADKISAAPIVTGRVGTSAIKTERITTHAIRAAQIPVDVSVPATMKAAVYRGVDDFRVETVPVPLNADGSLDPGEVLVRIDTCGICGTD